MSDFFNLRGLINGKGRNSHNTEPARFDAQYIPEPNSGCWLWIGAVNNKGYGRIRVNGKQVLAHRASYEAIRGAIPVGFVVLHVCDNSICVNPYHLRIGTQAQNLADMRIKGRGNIGERNGQRKLTESQALEIRNSRVPLKRAAEMYGVSRQTIYNIRKNLIWKHVNTGELQ